MKRKLLFTLSIILGSYFHSFAQCTTTNATSCVCETPGSTDCDLLPDLTVARAPLLVIGSNGVVEYAQAGNGANNGRLRVSVSSPNIGHGPLEIRGTTSFICGTDTITGTAPATCPNTGLPPRQLVAQRIYHKDGNSMSFYDRDAGSMTYHPTHGHMHVDEWGEYTLRSQSTDPNPLNWPIIGSGAKLGFCLMDYGSCSTYNGHCVDSLGNTLVNSSFPNFGLGGGSYNCSSTMQGISAGFTDIYYQYLDGMYINIPPGICNGNYFIVVEIDPNNFFLEEDESNNVMVVPFTLTKQAGTIPVITPSGSTALCPGESVTLTSSPAPSYLWSTGDTTQSITVTQLGNYSVTTDVNTTCPGSSTPIAVTAQSVSVNVTPTAAAVCDGSSTDLVVSVPVPPTGIVQTSFTNPGQYFIPDNNSTGVSSPITVSGVNPATLSPGSVFSVNLNLTHTYTGDLVLELVAPSGDKIKLSNRRGGAGDNFINTTFSMSANTPVANGSTPFTGSFVPDEFFSLLTGNVNGVWELKAIDLAGADTGRIQNWTLSLNDLVPAPITYSWTSTPPGFTSTDPNPIVTPSVPTTYHLTVTNSINGCTGTASATVDINANPVVTFSAINPVCNTNPGFLLSEGVPSGGNYSGTGVSSNMFYAPIAGSGTHTITYEYTDQNGCNGSATQTVQVNSAPAQPGVMQGVIQVCAGSKQNYSVAVDPLATSYAWAVPVGVQILNGQGTGSVQLQFANNFTSGSLCVYATNTCGSSQPQCMTVVRKHRMLCNDRTNSPAVQRDNFDTAGDNLNLSVQPNPASSYADLYISGTNAGEYRLSILNLLGKEVSSEMIQVGDDDQIIQLDLTALAKGVYLVSVSNSEFNGKTRLVVQ